MKAIKLRTKIEAAMAIIFVIILAVAGVASVTRMISDSSDNSYTFIRNSNGNYWEPIGSNVQLAIDDLDNDNGGTVWVGSSVTLDSPIYMKNYVQLDFQNNKVTLANNIEFAIFTEVTYAAVRNAYVAPSTYHTKSLILMHLKPADGWDEHIRHNVVENIRMVEQSSFTAQHNWTGIHIKMDGNSDLLHNAFRDISIFGCKNGIVLEGNHNGAWGNGNIFENIIIDRYVNGIWFIDCDGNSFNSNLFNHVQFQTVGTSLDPNSGYTGPCWGVRDISGSFNHFDHCIVWDWHVADNGQYSWLVTEDATDTVISVYEPYKFNYDYLLDDGTNTLLEMGGFQRPIIFYETYPPSGYEDGQVMIWIDTDNGDATYLCFFWEGNRKMIELT